MWRVQCSKQMQRRGRTDLYLLVLPHVPKVHMRRWRYRDITLKVDVVRLSDRLAYRTYTLNGEMFARQPHPDHYFTYAEACLLADQLNVAEFGRCE